MNAARFSALCVKNFFKFKFLEEEKPSRSHLALSILYLAKMILEELNGPYALCFVQDKIIPEFSNAYTTTTISFSVRGVIRFSPRVIFKTQIGSLHIFATFSQDVEEAIYKGIPKTEKVIHEDIPLSFQPCRERWPTYTFGTCPVHCISRKACDGRQTFRIDVVKGGSSLLITSLLSLWVSVNNLLVFGVESRWFIVSRMLLDENDPRRDHKKSDQLPVKLYHHPEQEKHASRTAEVTFLQMEFKVVDE
ncbi:hypothetical protein Tco_0859578 [Tanacetum coccineum]|uniref:Uncharacterized protein n=1 Tax=Tanacetum coccineum TaxID=301880 RepID=A0ABQ5BD30_9ASTR